MLVVAVGRRAGEKALKMELSNFFPPLRRQRVYSEGGRQGTKRRCNELVCLPMEDTHGVGEINRLIVLRRFQGKGKMCERFINLIYPHLVDPCGGVIFRDVRCII